MDEFDIQLQDALARKRAGQQAAENFQMPQGRMVGGRYIGPSISDALIQGLRMYQGQQDAEQAGKRIAELTQGRQKAIADALRNFGQQAQGTPENAPGDGMGPVLPAQAPDMMGAYQSLLNAPDAGLRQMALQGMARIPEMQAQREARADEVRMRAEQRAQELQAQHQMRMEQLAAQNASREQMAQQQQTFQREMLSLRASMRPEPAPRQAQIIQTDAGPMQLVDGKAVPIMGADGQPVKAPAGQAGNKPLTESQAKGSLYLGQMKSATSELDKLPSVSPALTAAAGNTLTNWAAPVNAQKTKQLQNQWSEAYLRAKTGAAATAQEVDLNVRTFFPVVGDSKEVIAQKRQMRMQAERDMVPVAGPGAQSAGTPAQGGGRTRIRFDAQGNPIQ